MTADQDSKRQDELDLASASREALQEEVVRLQELARAFSLLNSTLDLDIVLLHTLNIATKLMGAEMGSIALINEAKTHLVFVESTDKDFNRLKELKVPIGKGISGFVAQTGQSVRVDDVNVDHRFYTEVDKRLQHTTRTYLCVPLTVKDEIIGTAQLMNRQTGEPFTQKDEDLMNGFARQAALAIQNARLHRIQMKQQAIESELRVCSDIQLKLYPSPITQIHGYQFYGESVPCREVGGDYYTFIPRQDGTVDAIVGDVSGKGLTAAMLVSEVHTGVHLLSRMDTDLGEAVRTLNNHLTETLIIGKFITFFGARFTPDRGQFDYVVAGHPPPYIISRDGSVRELKRTGAVLGIPNNTITMEQDEMQSGDLLVAFSDGYSEAQNSRGDLFTEERIAESVKQWVDLELPVIAAKLNAEIEKFRNGHPQMDDATLSILRKL